PGARVAESRAATDVCRNKSGLAIRACQGAAQVSKMAPRGKCQNVTDVAARKACLDQAAADAKDAFKTCMDERVVRQTSCKRLGPAAYEPVIDPANFPAVPKIDNPFFPIVPGTTFVYQRQT